MRKILLPTASNFVKSLIYLLGYLPRIRYLIFINILFNYLETINCS